MPRAVIALGEYMPDRPALGNPGLLVAEGVWPAAQGYKPIGQFAASVNGTLPGDCLGAATTRSAAGITFTVAGTATNLYRYTSSGWASVGSGYSASASLGGWQFVQWGNLILATNGSNPVQRLDMGDLPPAFGALAGSPPLGEIISVVRDFVVLGRTAGNPRQLQWSGINQEEDWVPGVNLSDTQLMPTGGDILGIAGGEVGIILQESRLVRMSFVGAPDIFQFDEIGDNVGCIARGSVVRIGALTYFLSHQGFVRTDGNMVAAIGDEKVNRTVRAAIKRGFFNGMSAAVDLANSLIFWALPDAQTSTQVIVYNYTLDTWASFLQPTQRLFQSLEPDKSLEEVSAIFPNLDTMPVSLDDESFKGGLPQVMLINDSAALGTLSGSPKAARFASGEVPLASGGIARMTRVRALVDTVSGLTVTVSGSAERGGALTSEAFTGVNRFGDIPIRAAYRYPRIELSIAAGTAWREATGMEIEFNGGGK